MAEEALVSTDEVAVASVPPPPPPVERPAEPAATPEAPPAAAEPAGPPKMLLREATEACIAAYTRAKAWSPSTCRQVRTAIRLFEFANGGEVYVDDITQSHLRNLGELFAQLPNRWGRTREEIAGGLAASLERAKAMEPEQVGIEHVSRTKHLTWLQQVLDFAAGDGRDGHRPAEEISFRTLRKGIGQRATKRRRDKRAAWTRAEMERLLSAPVWTGSRSLDRRWSPGNEVYHDAWYWLPLMFVLYGGRSSELVALPRPPSSRMTRYRFSESTIRTCAR